MAILPETGRVVIAESIALRPLHVAWGLGDGAWLDTPPAENPSATALINEIGRRKVLSAGFVVPDANGSIEMPAGKFSVSATPTNNLLVEVQFDFTDASSSVIREFAIFAGCTTDPALPVGQTYFTPAQIVTPGRMLYVENMKPILRSPSIRQNIRAIITF